MTDRRPSYDQEASNSDGPAPAPESVEEWTGRYLDLIQRNWTAWLESTPAMFKAALAAADEADVAARGKAGEPDDGGRE